MRRQGGRHVCPVPFQRAANMIPAHDSPLAALAFDAGGTKLATASEKVRMPSPWPAGPGSERTPVPLTRSGRPPGSPRHACNVSTHPSTRWVQGGGRPEPSPAFPVRRSSRSCVARAVGRLWPRRVVPHSLG